ncbi:MAG: sigma-54-dependent Fis family transcriptional regulator [Candidatus Rokuibacteriota bacterium]|nr:MAG: sigma-54-dependent Fis family transcriptional regulator [Candidatus Rokubacteria bacterium]
MGPQLCGPDQRKCYDDATVHERIRVLVVDDDPEVRSLLGRVLTKSSWSTTEASSGADAMATLGRQEFDVVLLDVKLPDASGLDILRWARESDVDTEFVILTGNADVETAVEAMRLGAYDFVAKPWRNAELVQVIGKAAEKKDLRRENHALKEVMTRRDGMPHIVGDSPEIVDVVSMIARVAASDSPVLINGESGTGKELVARSVHLKSRRASRPFVSVNCGALPDTLLETELFGHKRGAFSGAVNSRVGLFEAADGGTLFLDEIGEMSPAMQVRLLRVLDSGEVRRVGEERAFNVDARIVAATNKDLNREATEGRFRWDLFYRVATIVIPVPALRRRRDDIPLLVQHFSAPGARGGQPLRFSADAMERLQRYEWPGNIRELRNLIERLQILHDGDEVQANALPAELTVVKRTAAEPAQTPLVSLQEMERQYVERVLQSTAWNKAQAARVLEVDIKTLNKKIRDFNIVRPA